MNGGDRAKEKEGEKVKWSLVGLLLREWEASARVKTTE
jgi:hypothetical protein